MRFSIDRWAKLAGVNVLREADEREARLSAAIEGYAVGRFDAHGDITIVIYDPVKMKAAVEGLSGAGNPVGEMPGAIVGLIRISPPAYGPKGDENSCRGAWEVVRSGVRTRGAGVGGLLYRLAAAASPTGKIMPDRREVSPSARNLWTAAVGRMSPEKRDASVLDDEENARTPDPDDDCIVHDYDPEKGPGSNVLNHAFDDLGGAIDVGRLTAAHEAFMDEISWGLPPGVDIDKSFYKAASKAFHEMTD